MRVWVHTKWAFFGHRAFILGPGVPSRALGREARESPAYTHASSCGPAEVRVACSVQSSKN